MFTLKNGDFAPEITLTDVRGAQWKLSNQIGKMVILHFGRGEFCPTTRGEFALWNSFTHIFKKMNCELAFIVNGGRAEHTRFAEQFSIRPPLLIDENGAIGTAYGLYEVNRPFRGDAYKIYTAPAVVLIDAEGLISCQWLLSGPRGRPTPECLLGVLGYAEHNHWKY